MKETTKNAPAKTAKEIVAAKPSEPLIDPPLDAATPMRDERKNSSAAFRAEFEKRVLENPANLTPELRAIQERRAALERQIIELEGESNEAMAEVDQFHLLLRQERQQSQELAFACLQKDDIAGIANGRASAIADRYIGNIVELARGRQLIGSFAEICGARLALETIDKWIIDAEQKLANVRAEISALKKAGVKEVTGHVMAPPDVKFTIEPGEQTRLST